MTVIILSPSIPKPAFVIIMTPHSGKNGLSLAGHTLGTVLRMGEPLASDQGHC